MEQEIQTITFQGNQILTVEKGGIQYVAMKPICESIGLDWHSQRQKIKKHPYLDSVTLSSTSTGKDGKRYKMQLLPIKFLQGWLFSVDVNRVKPEIKKKLIDYQVECFDLLHDYWKNKAVQPKTFDVSTAACLSELHVFLELTRGRMRISDRGNRHNTVSMSIALVLQHLYLLPDKNIEMRISCRELAKELKIAANSVRRSINKMEEWNFLTKKSKHGHMLWVYLNMKVIDEALQMSKNNLLTNQQRMGYLPSF